MDGTIILKVAPPLEELSAQNSNILMGQKYLFKL